MTQESQETQKSNIEKHLVVLSLLVTFTTMKYLFVILVKYYELLIK